MFMSNGTLCIPAYSLGPSSKELACNCLRFDERAAWFSWFPCRLWQWCRLLWFLLTKYPRLLGMMSISLSWPPGIELERQVHPLRAGAAGFFTKQWNNQIPAPSCIMFMWHVIWKVGRKPKILIGLEPSGTCAFNRTPSLRDISAPWHAMLATNCWDLSNKRCLWLSW